MVPPTECGLVEHADWDVYRVNRSTTIGPGPCFARRDVVLGSVARYTRHHCMCLEVPTAAGETRPRLPERDRRRTSQAFKPDGRGVGYGHTATPTSEQAMQ